MNREEIQDDILKISSNNILIELATGVGKTKIALELMNKKVIPDSRILIVVPRLVLINNWKDEFKKWGYENYLPNVTFVTYVSFPKKAGFWNMIIYDECHHLSERCRESLSSFSSTFNVLLSATVKRELRDALKYLFPSLVTYKVNARKAIENDILPDPKVYLIPLTLDSQKPAFTIVKNKNKGNPITIPYKYRWRYNTKTRRVNIICTQQQYYDDMTSFIEWCRPRIHAPIFKNMFLRRSGERLKWLSDQKTVFIHTLLDHLSKERTLTFCNSIAQTEQLGTNCINSKNKESKNILDNFNAGFCDHITACDMINEGVNLASCRVGIYASLNSSERIIRQKLGRILRHKDPIIIIPYFKGTRDEEIVKKMCEDYNPQLINVINNIKEIKL